MTGFRLQTLTFGATACAAPDDLYLRGAAGLVRDGVLALNDKRVSTDTFFNALTVATWKTHCRIDRLALVLTGEGTIGIRIGLHQSDGTHRCLMESRCDLDPGNPATIALPFWNAVSTGLLYCEFQGLSPRARLTGGWYATPDPPLRAVHLGIVITHFNRCEAVTHTAARIAAQLLADPDYSARVELVIVDNSRTLDQVPSANVIPNRNLGGSGGFMRGLDYLEQAGRFTHAVFMDDDATCEIESLRRSLALLSYSTTPRMAVAGALLSMAQPWRVIEKGASFDTSCRPHHAGLDVRAVPDLLRAESDPVAPTYGAWWFFAFSLRDVASYAFPFFLRGDDVQFSHANRANVVTMNGIASWGDDFALKDQPFHTYFDTRHHLIHALLGHGDGKTAARMVTGAFGGQAKGYRYANAAAVSLALDHVTRGPDFWAQDLELTDVRAALATLSAEQRDEPVDTAHCTPLAHDPHPGRWTRALRFVTYNGLFLPRWLLRTDAVCRSRQHPGSPLAIFGHAQVWYMNEATGAGFLAQHDTRRTWRERTLFKRRLRLFERNFNPLRSQYRERLPSMTSRAFWQRAFGLDQASGG